MASFGTTLRRALVRLWNPPWYQPVGFLVESLHLMRAYYVAAELGIADLLQQRPRDLNELAEATQTNGKSLHQILRALAAFGVFAEDRRGKFRMTRRARVLLSNPPAPYFGDGSASSLTTNPASLRSWLILTGRAELWQGFACTLEAVRTGTSPFQLAHGTHFYEYLSTHPELATVFKSAMSDWTLWQCRELVAAFDYGRFRQVIDVGGGMGTLLEHILLAHPQLRGILFDHAETVQLAKLRFEAAGLGPRCDFIGGNFLESIPMGADLCVLKHVVRDWNDANAEAVLRNCHHALAPGGVLLVIEAVVDPRNGKDRIVKLIDLEISSYLGGGLRTEAELSKLLERAGFRLTKIHGTAAPDSQVVEAVRLPSPDPMRETRSHADVSPEPVKSQ